MATDYMGIINLWELNRLPKTFDFKYSVSKNQFNHYFNSLKDAINFASAN